jgi:predicted nucleic acid-binding protein
MIIIDSSFWIEYFANNNFIEIINPLLKEPKEIIIPTIIITEVYKKLILIRDYDTAKIYISQFLSFNIIQNDFIIAMKSSELSITYKLPLADSIIYATALHYNAKLFTLDKHFEGLKNVEYFPKK